jgi:hypothetical protein
MTRETDICVRCGKLHTVTSAVIITGNGKSLISECYYGGKNAGYRKTCSKFEEADKSTIEARLKCLRGDTE